ncbi:hypothetical protein Tsp_03918 [Trichinella spiralis]|uniref:hypothetical protein n=1 Tax=Trichinella spiralis TaxID=6334 RepID=UPI0001EFC6F8|nr:hypothetical protein Tsp_03918 [Trichinella spiralis]
MDKFLGIFLFTFIFSVSAENVLCPSLNESEIVLLKLDAFPYCLVKVKTDKIETGFEPIQSFEGYCNKNYLSHLEWQRDLFIDPYMSNRQKNATYYMGYKAYDVDVNSRTITAISDGILRVDNLHWDSRMSNESSVTFNDIMQTTKYYQGLPEQLCLVGLSEDLSKNVNTQYGVIWERCTIRKTNVFYCKAQPLKVENIDFDLDSGGFKCHTGYVGNYCQIGTVDACSNVNCNNRGTCEVKNFFPVCNCTDEMYEGAFCERRVSNKHLFEEVSIMNFQSMINSFD